MRRRARLMVVALAVLLSLTFAGAALADWTWDTWTGPCGDRCVMRVAPINDSEGVVEYWCCGHHEVLIVELP